MGDLWERINDDMPLYLESICKKYKLTCMKVSPINTAVIGKKFALIFGIDRFDLGVYYLYMDGRELKAYSCRNYFAKKYDENDCVNLRRQEGAENIVRDAITVTMNGLPSKWQNVLEGDMGWIEDYKKTAWFSELTVVPERWEKIAQYF